jgi:hypothetical protein
MSLLLVAPLARADRIDECNAAYEQSQELRLEHKLRASRAQLEVCARATCPHAMRTDCGTWLREVTRAIPSVVVTGDRAGATATIDGAPVALDGTAVEQDPGRHHVVMTDPRTHESTAIDVDIAEGDKNKRLELHFVTPVQHETVAPKPGPPWYAWVIGGVGTAGIVSTIAWGTAALVLQDDLRGSCYGSCPHSDVQAVHDRALVADISLAIGVVGLGVATVLFLWPRSPPRTARLVTTGIEF